MIIICNICGLPFEFDRYARPNGSHGGKTPKNCLRAQCRSLKDHIYYEKWKKSHDLSRYQIKKQKKI